MREYLQRGPDPVGCVAFALRDRGIRELAPQLGRQHRSGRDDREDVAELARTILRDFGYTTLVAGNAREALEILDSSERVDLLFTDLIMPGGMNGVLLAREARRRQPKLKDVP